MLPHSLTVVPIFWSYPHAATPLDGGSDFFGAIPVLPRSLKLLVPDCHPYGHRPPGHQFTHDVIRGSAAGWALDYCPSGQYSKLIYKRST